MPFYNSKNLPKAANYDVETPVQVEDLRPAFGHLNWQLRRFGLTLQVKTNSDNSNTVAGVELVQENRWVVKCDNCAFEYNAGRAKYPECPKCNTQEIGDSL